MNRISMELIVTVRGWNHSSWYGSFYPDDLPEDWRLSFFSNEFRAIVVPASEWIDVDPVEIERWVDDTHEEFVFFLEVEDHITNWHKIEEQTRFIGEQMGGFLFRPVELDSDLALISSNLSTAAKIAPVSLLLPSDMELSQKGQGLLKELAIELCWEVGQGEPGWAGKKLDSRLAIARVTGNKSFTARELREIIETCLAYGDSKQESAAAIMLLLIESDEPLVTDLRTATMIGDMLACVEIEA